MEAFQLQEAPAPNGADTAEDGFEVFVAGCMRGEGSGHAPAERA
jgi:hypothetical protein